MDKNFSILYVEDDQTIGFLTRDNLERRGYDVLHLVNGRLALEALGKQKFDLCLLDIMLPEMDGFSLAKEIRSLDKQIPILFLTARSLVEDKIKGFSLGGDDYITKPFSIDELVLRIEVFRKRHKVSEQYDNATRLGNTLFDYENQKLKTNTGIIQLTHRENELLNLFVKNPNTLLKRDEILCSIWGDDDFFLGRSLDVFISRLRKFLKDTDVKIENVHGVGFRLIINPHSA